MSRISRENSKTITKLYHILIRGVNKQDIFLDKQDKMKFLRELKILKEEYEYTIYAYVLMSNHVHIIILDNENMMSKLMHKLCSKYAMYFNKKYNRVGHVFQNRFKSICIDTEEYLKNLVRYIHRNPEKAGICCADEYKWSSYKEYVYKQSIVETSFVLGLFSDDRKKAIDSFVYFNKQNEKKYSDAELEMENSMNNEEAMDCIKRILEIDDISTIKNFNTMIRNLYVCKIYKIKGISVRQMSELLEISQASIYKILENKK